MVNAQNVLHHHSRTLLKTQHSFVDCKLNHMFSSETFSSEIIYGFGCRTDLGLAISDMSIQGVIHDHRKIDSFIKKNWQFQI